MNATAWSRGLEVTGGGTGVVSHAGLVLLRQLADRTGLTGRNPGARRHGVRSACDSERPTTVTHGQSWSLDGNKHTSAQSAFVLVRAPKASPKLVVRDRIELSTFR